MADFPAMPLWTDAYLADTRHLTTLEHGAYLLLLMEAWRRPTRSLPDDDRLLARLAGLSIEEWQAIKDTIMSFWKRDGRSRTWSQKRLSLEATYVANKSRSQRDKAVKRWNKTEKNDATAMPERCPDDAPTPTPTPIVIEDEPLLPISDTNVSSPNLRPEHVVEFWNEMAERTGLPKVRPKLQPERRRVLLARIKDRPLADWVEAFAAIERSPFLKGATDRWQGASFDWMLKPANFSKVIEGNYDPKR